MGRGRDEFLDEAEEFNGRALMVTVAIGEELPVSADAATLVIYVP